MKILHISKFAYPERGGIETFVRDLSRQQQRDGHEVRILCHHVAPHLRTNTVDLSTIPVTRAHILCSFSFAPISPIFPLLLRRLLRKESPQILHLHLPNPAVLFNTFFPKNIPLVIHWHADVHGSPSKRLNALYPLYRIFERQTLAKAAQIIVSSPPYLESSPALVACKEKCSVIPLGLDESRYPISPAETKVTPPLIVSVGRFTYYKGFEYLVRAARIIPEGTFVIAGDGPLLPTIQKDVERLGLSDRVHLPGAISDEDLQALLQKASIFCLPSVDRGEAFGISQLEAMRYGLPLVSTAIPGSGTSWVNQHQVTGLVVPPTSPEGLARAFRELLDHPERAKTMGRAAHQRYKKDFTIEQVAEAVDRIYSEITT